MKKERLRFITCGSVDDGKSTLIGRLLYDSGALTNDKLDAAQNESKKYGSVGGELDLALLTDGLLAEREQGITIDVAHIFFSSKERSYIVADSPGHEQYTRNMATAASEADAAIILIDARKGVLTQTKRHAFIASLLGVKSLIVAINKMDAVEYSNSVFLDIKSKFDEEIAQKLNLQNLYFVPISALNGDNVVVKSDKMESYEGATLIEILDSLDVSQTKESKFRLPIQYVNRPNLDFRGFCTTVIGGEIREDEEILILPSGKKTRIKKIIKPSIDGDGYADFSTSGEAITFTTSEEVDISRGDVVVKSDDLPHISDLFEAKLIWMSDEPLKTQKSYDIKIGFQNTIARIASIEYKIDPNSYEQKSADSLALNDIALCLVECDRKVVFDLYKEGKATGAFILIDRLTNQTVGAGMIEKATQKETNDDAYGLFEIELNALIRRHFPHWNSKAIG